MVGREAASVNVGRDVVESVDKGVDVYVEVAKVDNVEVLLVSTDCEDCEDANVATVSKSHQ